ncbi:hypothetical protein [Mycobacterium sp. D16R24]|uniref:hypothetical protein n=1 Tax=Mycobacterium sp. D16R24 TaxID=1855656 RepID=UPI00099348BC|nr:hypothetical protein [Mycobacterium sp. D16R24]
MKFALRSFRASPAAKLFNTLEALDDAIQRAHKAADRLAAANPQAVTAIHDHLRHATNSNQAAYKQVIENLI